MKLKNIFFIFATLLVLTTTSATIDQAKVNQANTDNLNINQGEGSQINILDRLTNTLFSFSDIQSSYSPGEFIDGRISAEATETFDVEDSTKIVEVYRCADTGCDNPPPISSSSEDSCSEAEWGPDYDDCIAKQSDTVGFSYTLEEGKSFGWNVEFDAPREEGQYIFVGYVHKNGFVTDVSKEKFVVESSNTDDGSTSDPDSVNLEITGGPSATYDSSSQKVSGSITITNNGDKDMGERDLLEMQIRPEGGNLLSVFSSNNVCDDSAPENVNTYFQLDAGESKTFNLESSQLGNLDDGEKYDVRFLTRNDCYPDNEAVEPIPTDITAETFTFKVPKADVELGSESIDVSVSNDTVSTSFSLVNTGDKDMATDHIVEMQVRPSGSGLLAINSLTGVQDTCDESTPENVHRRFFIKSGESVDVNLETGLSNLNGEGSYDVWIVTREGCGEGPVEPFGTGINVGSFQYEQDNSRVTDDNDKKPGKIPLMPIGVGLIITSIVAAVIYKW